MTFLVFKNKSTLILILTPNSHLSQNPMHPESAYHGTVATVLDQFSFIWLDDVGKRFFQKSNE
jgi:hypothetical protein